MANRLPDQSETILVSQLQRRPELHLLAGDLLEQFGLKHWSLVKKSYAAEGRPPDHRDELIPMVLHVAGDEARQRLAELFALDDLNALGPLQESYRQARFQRFVQAANALNRAPVITEAEERAATYLGGKGSRQTEAEIAMVPENRRKALDKLRAFFK
jgi:hypothetical protein